MSKRASPAVIGAFVVSAVILGVVAVGVFGSGHFFRQLYPAVLFFQGDVNGLKVGAPVKFKGIPVGTVKSILLGLNQVTDTQAASQSFFIPVVVEFDGKNIVEKGGRTAHPDRKTIAELVGRGLRGQLKMESFVTGVLYVDLGLYPGTSADLRGGPNVPYPEIPTLPTALEEAQAKAAEFLSKLNQVDLQGLVSELKTTVSHLDQLASSPGLKKGLEDLPATLEEIGQAADQIRQTLGKVESDADQTLVAARDTLRSADAVLAPDSPLLYRLTQTFDDLALAAASIRRLADDLERNPSMLLRGRAEPKGAE